MSKKSMQRTATIYGALALVAGGNPAASADWGYESVPAESSDNAQSVPTHKSPAAATPVKKQDELRAAPARSLNAPAVKSTAPAKPVVRAPLVPSKSAPPASASTAVPHKLPGSSETPLPPPMTVDGQRSIYANPERERRQGILIAWCWNRRSNKWNHRITPEINIISKEV